jgi:hypothetical protein
LAAARAEVSPVVEPPLPPPHAARRTAAQADVKAVMEVRWKVEVIMVVVLF